jgi:hypothetical protein
MKHGDMGYCVCFFMAHRPGKYFCEVHIMCLLIAAAVPTFYGTVDIVEYSADYEL